MLILKTPHEVNQVFALTRLYSSSHLHTVINTTQHPVCSHNQLSPTCTTTENKTQHKAAAARNLSNKIQLIRN